MFGVTARWRGDDDHLDARIGQHFFETGYHPRTDLLRERFGGGCVDVPNGFDTKFLRHLAQNGNVNGFDHCARAYEAYSDSLIGFHRRIAVFPAERQIVKV
jgi:hypothetical protein